MWAPPASVRIAAVAWTAAAAFAVGCVIGATVNGWRLNAAHATEMTRLHNAGVTATEKRQATITDLREKAREDAGRIADLSRNARVRVCPPARLPPAGRGADPGAAGAGGEAGEDITDILRQCLRTFGEVNRTLEQQK